MSWSDEALRATDRDRWDTASIHIGHLPAAASDEHYELHLAAVEHELASPIIIESRKDILSQKHWAERVEPFEHQIKNLITFCRRAPVALIADDVGLGKTISAGLVLNELQTRRRVRRALILCPKVMLDQWKEELESKFGMPDVEFAVGQELTMLLRRPSAVVVTTYESARDRMGAFRRAGFDMVILDEAHKLRNLYGDKTPPKLAKAIHEELSLRTFRYVLMLSATPIQNRLWDIYSLMDCLAAAKGHDNPLGSTRAFASYYVADGPRTARVLHPGRRDEFRRKVQDYMVRTSRGTAGLSFPERLLKSVACKPKAQEARLYDLVGDVMREALNPLTRISIAEALLSSPRALRAQLLNMVKNGSVSEDHLEELEGPIKNCAHGCKLEQVLKICKELHAENPSSWRVLVFTRRKETLALIQEAMTAKGYLVGTISGGSHMQNQRSIKSFWQDPPGCNVLVSTDAGAVGLNLQVCNVLINYDLPWNPMVLEQRIGRVQRLGSKFRHVVVWNLTVKGTLEDLIVARLLEKLHAVAETLGDIESVLEASTWGSQEGFEKELRALVTQALMGVDVRDALERAQRSIERARAIYEEERSSVEENLGSLDAMHSAGPKVPKLSPRIPRFSVRKFCHRAFVANGATVKELTRSRLQVESAGRASWVAVFDEDDPDLEVSESLYGGSRALLYQEGSPHFERLTGEWRKSHAHRVLDRREESVDALPAFLEGWGEAMGLVLGDFRIRNKVKRFRGHAVVRGSAAVAHDRYEKLCIAEIAREGHGELVVPPEDDVPSPEELSLSEVATKAEQHVRAAVEADPDIMAFTSFYDARQQEELERSGDSFAAQRDVASRFETALAAEVVGVQGAIYWEILVEAHYRLPDAEESHPIELLVIPLAEQVTEEPERVRCEVSDRDVPVDWLATCSKSGKQVLVHLLWCSAVSGQRALPEHFATCAVSGRIALVEETGESSVSQARVCLDLLLASPVSGRAALETEMVRCTFTGDLVLPDEVRESAVSGQVGRSDQFAESVVSGVVGHVSEFVVCEVTEGLLLPDEGARTSLDDRFVRRDLLLPSGKNPERFGIAEQFVECSVTGNRLLLDEAVQSAVSQVWVDRDLAKVSEVSGGFARPEELVVCDVSGVSLLPSECARSEVSDRLVDRRLLETSAASERLALPDEFVRCEITGAAVLPDELVVSDVSGRSFRADELVVSGAGGARGHRSELIQCEETEEWLLVSESAKSDVSGKVVGAHLLQPSDLTPERRCLPSEGRRCAVSGRFLLPDEVAASAVSGKLVGSDLVVESFVSGARMLPDEAVTCALTGKPMLPKEAGYSGVSGRATDARNLQKSEVSGLLLLEDEVGKCEFTGAVVAQQELFVSAASGRRARRDQVSPSSVSGQMAHRSELETCTVTGGLALPSELGVSTLSGKKARKDILQASQKNPGRLGLPDEFKTCAVTGQRLLLDEGVASAISDQWMDRAAAVVSHASGRMGLPLEAVVCEESSATLLQDEVCVCAVSGKRVDQRLVDKSDVSGAVGLSRLLVTCPETGRRGFERELSVCEVTGNRVVKSVLRTCAVTGRTAVERLFVSCAISGQHLLKEKAVTSARSGRVAMPDRSRTCGWTGQVLLEDEVHECPMTGLVVSSTIPVTWASEPLVSLVSQGLPKDVPPDAGAAPLIGLLKSHGRVPRGLRIARAPLSGHIAFIADVSTLLGLRKRHLLGYALLGAAPRFVARLAEGRCEAGRFTQTES